MYSKVLVPLLLFIAVLEISANVLPTAFHDEDDDVTWEMDDDDFSDDPEDLTRIPITVDYRQSKCMPPIKQGLTVFDGATESCFYTPIYVNPVVMSEYLDCKSSGSQVLRNFSVQQMIHCVYAFPPCWEFLPTLYDQAYIMKYILFTGLSLSEDYEAAVAKAENDDGITDTCVTSYTQPAYKFTRGYRTLKQLDETHMRRVVRYKGPIVANLYFKDTEIYKMYDPNAQDVTGMKNYTSGVLDHEAFCIPSVTDPSYKQQDVLAPSLILSKGYQVPVMIVGFTKYEGVPVWIVRSDWFGENWGMKGYFYLKRGVNACNVALSPIRVLG